MSNNIPYLVIKRKVVFDLLDKFPDAPTRTLARILYKDNTCFFKDYEDARLIIRRYRGQNGASNRKDITFRKYFKEIKVKQL